MNLLLFLIPDEWLVIVIAGISLAVILGIVRIGWAMGAVAAIIGMIIFSPFIESLISNLSPWVLYLILIWLAFYLLRLVVGLFLGNEAAGSFIGRLAYDLFSLPFRILFGFLRIIVQMVARRGRI